MRRPLAWCSDIPVSYTHLDVYKRQIHHHVANTYDDVICQSGKDAPHDKFDEEAAHNRGSLLETFRGREAGTQKPQQDAHCNKGDHTGNAMENGRSVSYTHLNRTHHRW